MKRKAKALVFISQINRDGSGTTPVSDEYLEMLNTNKFVSAFTLYRLSLSEDTFIARGFNSFVVRLKKPVASLIKKK